MRLDLYYLETARIAREQTAMLDEAAQRFKQEHSLSSLEQSGVLHALQVLIENAIGKAKQILKASGEPVPVSAYDAFSALARCGEIATEQLAQWNAVVGLRNRIVRDYMNIDMNRVQEWVVNDRYRFVSDFLLASPEQL
ncbi:MAG: DUF86 domain-containing protein [Propionivibrio sp.]|uniref:DUF86 domain-containing protein n=1 Tax=Candidatus Propionivibrio dominans TaxID=2954373 RepID=A0A9D7I6A1_9RHOO|nr:DUF86 domain-containing protein [Candidatus Propionivibrio dominans]